MTDEEELLVGETPMPAREFVDNGLLHAVNYDWFWPYGMALTARSWIDDERIRAELVPAIRHALLESAAEVRAWDSEDSPSLDALMDALWPRLVAAAGEGGLVGRVVEGFTIMLTDPPDDYISALPPEEAAARKEKAQEWRSARIRAIYEAREGNDAPA